MKSGREGRKRLGGGTAFITPTDLAGVVSLVEVNLMRGSELVMVRKWK